MRNELVILFLFTNYDTPGKIDRWTVVQVLNHQLRFLLLKDKSMLPFEMWFPMYVQKKVSSSEEIVIRNSVLVTKRNM